MIAVDKKLINSTVFGTTLTVGGSLVISMKKTRRKQEINGREGRLTRSTKLRERRRRLMRLSVLGNWLIMLTTVIPEYNGLEMRKRMRNLPGRKPRLIKQKLGRMRKKG